MSHATLTEFPQLDPRPPTPHQLDAEAQSTDWQTLFRLAGISALTVVALIPMQGFVYIVWPPPTTVLEYFAVFHSNPLLGFLDLLLVIDQVLIVVVLLGLYIALRRVDASMMLIGTAAGLLGATVMIVSRQATFSMFSLSQQYALATAASQRAPLEAGHTLLKIYNSTAFSLGYFLTGLGLLLISRVVLRSGLFSRLAALSGVVAGVAGLIPASMGTLGFVVSFPVAASADRLVASRWPTLPPTPTPSATQLVALKRRSV